MTLGDCSPTDNSTNVSILWISKFMCCICCKTQLGQLDDHSSGQGNFLITDLNEIFKGWENLRRRRSGFIPPPRRHTMAGGSHRVSGAFFCNRGLFTLRVIPSIFKSISFHSFYASFSPPYTSHHTTPGQPGQTRPDPPHLPFPIPSHPFKYHIIQPPPPPPPKQKKPPSHFPLPPPKKIKKIAKSRPTNAC